MAGRKQSRGYRLEVWRGESDKGACYAIWQPDGELYLEGARTGTVGEVKAYLNKTIMKRLNGPRNGKTTRFNRGTGPGPDKEAA